ncbi:superoxide dismutase family protein, partial [Francisella tularensis subsp. holarctica]|nr:superoxide dismutase family protein [Francisella tularensis subsp. holarctica]
MDDFNQEVMLITPHLYNLPANTTHVMHIHINPSCEDNGIASGGHWDQDNTQKHLGPYNDHGHEGDLPVLVV